MPSAVVFRNGAAGQSWVLAWWKRVIPRLGIHSEYTNKNRLRDAFGPNQESPEMKQTCYHK